ncbi:DUF1064 domain-containing protein [Methanoregula sp.]|jgi:hypothetical protein|uniref:DUF1064 domain-containing protein n=1 Tax=Methanoregula sp. TaxID=2052170 RepID=UPI00356766FF
MNWPRRKQGDPRILAQKTPIEIDGKIHNFPSKLEAGRYLELKRMLDAGIVKSIELQPTYELQPAYRKCCGLIRGAASRKKKDMLCPICGKKSPVENSLVYRPDFKVTYSDGHVEIEEVKGFEQEVWKIKRKIFEYQNPGITLKIIKAVRR